MPEPLSLDQTDLVIALVRLRNKISELVLIATTEGPADCPWAELAELLELSARLCRRQVVLESPE
ncbi:hypothetical protein [Actinokineospora pegani]|uniref:hypothetical protein n=1 Tax=Actinokineospora pegani TaxID=2654637 RepID=UPI0012EAAB12|nr:hypothetical protein [Actinokineospora pegani]